MTAVRPGRWKVGWRTVGWNSAFCLPRCTRIPHWRTNLASAKQGIIRCRIVPEGAAARPYRGLGFRPKGRSRNVSDPGRGPVALPPRSSAAMAGPRRRMEDRLASRTRSLAVLLRWLRARGWSMGSSSARRDHPAPVRKSFSPALPRHRHRPRTDIRATPRDPGNRPALSHSCVGHRGWPSCAMVGPRPASWIVRRTFRRVAGARKKTPRLQEKGQHPGTTAPAKDSDGPGPAWPARSTSPVKATAARRRSRPRRTSGATHPR